MHCRAYSSRQTLPSCRPLPGPPQMYPVSGRERDMPVNVFINASRQQRHLPCTSACLDDWHALQRPPTLFAKPDYMPAMQTVCHHPGERHELLYLLLQLCHGNRGNPTLDALSGHLSRPVMLAPPSAGSVPLDKGTTKGCRPDLSDGATIDWPCASSTCRNSPSSLVAKIEPCDWQPACRIVIRMPGCYNVSHLQKRAEPLWAR